MPYKSEKIKIEHTDKDRRIKLTDEQKDKIIALRGILSCHKVSEIFNVCRRTIQFLWYPERLERNKQKRQERGGWGQYYDKNKWKETMKEHRHYKQKIYLEGKIDNEGLF